MKISLRQLVSAALFAAVVGSAGGALAYWLAPGTGFGSANVPAPAAVTLGPGTPASTLIPGRQSDVVLTVSNPNSYALHIGSFVLDSGQGSMGYAVDAAHAGCAVSTLSFTTQTRGGAGWAVPAKVGSVNGKLAVTLPNALAMDVNAASACQGASASVYLIAGA